MTTLTDIAANYKRAACLMTGDGREWWRVEADRQVWLFTPDEVEQMLAAIVPRQRPPHCHRCEILTDDGGLCAECQWELEHDGRYQYMDEMTGEVM